MGFLVSPGVDVNEIDLTNVIPAVSTSIGGIVGHFKWGPVEEVVSVGSEKELVARYGKPDENNYGQWFQASAFLQYGNALNVYRNAAASSQNANSSGSTGYSVKNTDNYQSQTLSVSDSPIVDNDYFVARYPGALGNSLEVCVLTNENFDSNANTIATGAVRGAPTAGEIHIVVIDEDGDISGTANTVLEVYQDLTVSAGKYDDGTSSYYVDVLESSSQWIWPTSNVISATDSPADDYIFSFTGGADGTKPETADLAADYSTAFGDAETLDVNILIGPVSNDSTAVAYAAAIQLLKLHSIQLNHLVVRIVLQ